MNIRESGTNSFTIAGKIGTNLAFSHEMYGEGFYSFKIDVPRLSGYNDILPVTISERLMEDSIKKDAEVIINGQLRSYNRYVDGSNRLIITLFSREIIMNKEVKLKNPNEVFLDGFICKPCAYRTTPLKREITDILVAVNRVYNKSDYIPVIAWGRNARYASELQVGDRIMVWGRVQSREYQKLLDSGEVINKVAYEVSLSKIKKVTEQVEEVDT